MAFWASEWGQSWLVSMMCVAEKFHMSVRAPMACVPNYFKCKVEMLSWPVEDFFCLSDGLTNYLCCEWYSHVCVLRDSMQMAEYVSLLFSMFSLAHRCKVVV